MYLLCDPLGAELYERLLVQRRQQKAEDRESLKKCSPQVFIHIESESML